VCFSGAGIVEVLVLSEKRSKKRHDELLEVLQGADGPGPE